MYAQLPQLKLWYTREANRTYVNWVWVGIRLYPKCSSLRILYTHYHCPDGLTRTSLYHPRSGSCIITLASLKLERNTRHIPIYCAWYHSLLYEEQHNHSKYLANDATCLTHLETLHANSTIFFLRRWQMRSSIFSHALVHVTRSYHRPLHL